MKRKQIWKQRDPPLHAHSLGTFLFINDQRTTLFVSIRTRAQFMAITRRSYIYFLYLLTNDIHKYKNRGKKGYIC